jgi:hypothetical protein
MNKEELKRAEVEGAEARKTSTGSSIIELAEKALKLQVEEAVMEKSFGTEGGKTHSRLRQTSGAQEATCAPAKTGQPQDHAAKWPGIDALSDSVVVELHVWAPYLEEIKEIEMALREPSQELITWYAKTCSENSVNLTPNIKESAAFERIGKPEYLDVSFARTFRTAITESWGLVWSHVHFVSRNFPTSIFFAEYWDILGSYDGKKVIRAGNEIRCFHDGDHQFETNEWALPNIFAPYQVEYDHGLEFGSLWDKWVEGMQKAVADLAEMTKEKT